MAAYTRGDWKEDFILISEVATPESAFIALSESGGGSGDEFAAIHETSGDSRVHRGAVRGGDPMLVPKFYAHAEWLSTDCDGGTKCPAHKLPGIVSRWRLSPTGSRVDQYRLYPPMR